jgi:integrase
MAQRGNGDGTIYESGGKWWAVITLDVVDGKPVRRKRSGSTKTAAKALLKALQEELDANVKGGGDTTVEQHVHRWLTKTLPARRKNGRPISKATVENYACVADVHIFPNIGSKRLDALTVHDVEKMLERMADRGKSRSTISRTRCVLSQALARAVSHGAVMRNVADLAELPDTRVRADRKSLTAEQATAFLAELADYRENGTDRGETGYRYETAWRVQLQIALRPGEVLGLRWSDVDLDGARMTVQGSLHSSKAEGRYLGDVKTKGSKRVIQLPQNVVSDLRAHRERQDAEREGAGEMWTDMDLVFPTALGLLSDPRYYRRSFQAATVRAGLGKDWTPHELRHTCLSLLSDREVPLEKLAHLAGHSSTRTTSDVYVHRVAPSVDAAVGPMDAMFGNT